MEQRSHTEMDEGLIASKRVCTCDVCQSSMNWVECGDRSDGFLWQCFMAVPQADRKEKTSS